MPTSLIRSECGFRALQRSQPRSGALVRRPRLEEHASSREALLWRTPDEEGQSHPRDATFERRRFCWRWESAPEVRCPAHYDAGSPERCATLVEC